MIIQGGVILADDDEVLLETNAEIKTFAVHQEVILQVIKKVLLDMNCYTLQLIDCYSYLILHRYPQCLEKTSDPY